MALLTIRFGSEIIYSSGSVEDLADLALRSIAAMDDEQKARFRTAVDKQRKESDKSVVLDIEQMKDAVLRTAQSLTPDEKKQTREALRKAFLKKESKNGA